jgi:hypothetical protein
MKITFEIQNILCSIFITFVLSSCSISSKVTNDYQVECVSVGNDGTQLVKVWTYVKNPDKASSQAKINAVHAVIFKGINDGNNGCMQRGLVLKNDTEIKFKEYFESFFKRNGRYLSFVSTSGNGIINPADRIKTSNGYKIGIVISVRHAALRKELEENGIINKLWLED